MAHDLSLSDFDLPTPDELDGAPAPAPARCAAEPSTSTPGGSARLNLEEERLLESLLSSPGMSPLLPLSPELLDDLLLHTPTLSKLTTQVARPGRAAKAWGVSERCAGRVAAGGQLEPPP